MSNYDSWKLASPDDEYPYDGLYDDGPEDECGHEDYEVDILSGRATCNRCDFAWWQTKEQIAAEIEHIRAYDEWTREQERPWNRFKEWLRRKLPQRRVRLPPTEIDDEVPF